MKKLLLLLIIPFLSFGQNIPNTLYNTTLGNIGDGLNHYKHDMGGLGPILKSLMPNAIFQTTITPEYHIIHSDDGYDYTYLRFINNYDGNVLTNTSIYMLGIDDDFTPLNPDINNDGVFDYLDDNLLSQYCSEFNLEDMVDVINIIYAYDNSNNLIQTIINYLPPFDSGGEIDQIDYLYDLNNNVSNISVQRGNVLICVFEINYDNNNNIIEQLFASGNNSIGIPEFNDSTIYYSVYNDNNQIIQYTLNHEGIPPWNINFNYEQDGVLSFLEYQEFSYSGVLLDSYNGDVIYDSNGNIIALVGIKYNEGPYFYSSPP
ncbi:hypothetical protein OAJ42_00515 [Flavobacteriales bacterium]|nr:hypothetical protein [Flavobacteriales bacterium]